jgi:hypothetical protein
MDSNLLAVVVRKPDATKKRVYQLAFWWAVVIDSHSKAVVMAQTEHSTAGAGWKPRWSCPNKGFSIDHLLLHCEFARALWSYVFMLFGVEWVMPRTVLELLNSWGGRLRLVML